MFERFGLMRFRMAYIGVPLEACGTVEGFHRALVHRVSG